MTHKPSLRFPPRYDSARICASVKPQPAGPGAGSGGSAMRRRDVGTTTDGAELAGIGGRGRTAHPEASSGQVPCLHIPSGVEHRAVGHRMRSEEHTSELQSLAYLVCRLLLEKKKTTK